VVVDVDRKDGKDGKDGDEFIRQCECDLAFSGDRMPRPPASACESSHWDRLERGVAMMVGSGSRFPVSGSSLMEIP